MGTIAAMIGGVFSAHAEVVPFTGTLVHLTVGILRARGGSSLHLPINDDVDLYSPRTRR